MDISRTGKQYLNRTTRLDLIRVINDFKVGKLYDDDTFLFDLSDSVAYFITSFADDKSEALEDLNLFLRSVVNNLNKFNKNDKQYIQFVEQSMKCLIN